MFISLGIGEAVSVFDFALHINASYLRFKVLRKLLGDVSLQSSLNSLFWTIDVS